MDTRPIATFALEWMAELQLHSYIRLLGAARIGYAASHNGFSLAFPLSVLSH
jgi:hypothetical protein